MKIKTTKIELKTTIGTRFKPMALISPSAIAIRRYVISFIEIPSVRYLNIEKTANNPKAAPMEILVLFKTNVMMNMMILNRKKVNMNSLFL